MKSNLKVFLLSVGVLVASIGASINTVLAQSSTQTQVSSQWNIQHNNNHNLIADGRIIEAKDKELRAFYRSTYDYWDARVLSDYWKKSVEETQATMGRKMIWGAQNAAILKQSLANARTQAMRRTRSPSNPNAYKFYGESKYNYEDAVKLAKFWDLRTPTEAKLRIEQKLIFSQDEAIDQALRSASR